MKLFTTPIPKSTDLLIDGRSVTVAIRVHPRARSYKLTLPHSGAPVLTVPPNGRWKEAQGFLERHRPWLATRLARQPAAPALAAGGLVPIRGVLHRIVPTGQVRGTIALEAADDGPAIRVPGDSAHLERRILDWLRREARADLAERSAYHADRLGVTVTSISLRSQSTRWGSCSSRGALNYNWRLIAAPPHVLDYVAAHEVAHLVEMNHSKAFWATVGRTLPDYARGQAWLKANGRTLMALGA
jgi:predicted metal-dependent hydrolase